MQAPSPSSRASFRRPKTWTALAVAGLVLAAGCSNQAKPAEDAPPEGSASSAATPTPEAPQRTVTFAEPIETDFSCDCLSKPIGLGPEGQVAIGADLRMQSMPSKKPPRLVVVGADGKTAWSKKLDKPKVISGAPDAPAVAMDKTLVSVNGSNLVGYAWKDGKEVWKIKNVMIKPDLVGERRDVFVLASTLVGDELVKHPQVTLVDAATGKSRWTGKKLAGYASDDEGTLVAATASKTGASLTKIDPESGKESSIKVPAWKGQLLSLSVEGDVVSAYVGPEGKNKELSVKVDWAAGKATKASPSGEKSVAPKGKETIDTSDDGQLTLAAAVDGKGVPTTVTMLDGTGKTLWDAPAEDVASWGSEDGEVSISGVDVYSDPAATGPPRGIALVDRRLSIDADQGAVAGESASALTALDATTGEELWSWGERTSMAQSLIMPEEGVAFLAAGGAADQSGKPTPFKAELLDLYTGEPDWSVDGKKTAGISLLQLDQTVVIPSSDGPWRISAQTKR